MDSYNLHDYFAWNEPQDGLSLVYKVDDRIAGAMYISVHERYLVVEMLGKNILAPGTHVGTKLMMLAENVAHQLGKAEIRLESLDTVVEWYDGPLGYSEYTSRTHDAEFGLLTPKRKSMQE